MKIEILYIIFGFILGVIIVYVMTSSPKIVYKYPSIENIQSLTFVNDKNVCYKYYATEIPCPEKFQK